MFSGSVAARPRIGLVAVAVKQFAVVQSRIGVTVIVCVYVAACVCVAVAVTLLDSLVVGQGPLLGQRVQQLEHVELGYLSLGLRSLSFEWQRCIRMAYVNQNSMDTVNIKFII